MPIYSKPVRELMKEMVPALGIVKGKQFTRQEAVSWFASN